MISELTFRVLVLADILAFFIAMFAWRGWDELRARMRDRHADSDS